MVDNSVKNFLHPHCHYVMVVGCKKRTSLELQYNFGAVTFRHPSRMQ